ncbi:MAG: hypothetical protein JWN89_143 [Parcubacteria group bacterium]|nr:hypothetical protein [Parcubacteria group bacterium]
MKMLYNEFMNKLVSAILSLYIGSFLFTVLPLTKVLTGAAKGMPAVWSHLGVFVLFCVPVWFVMNRIVQVNPGRGMWGMMKTVLLSLGCAGIILSILYHIIPIKSLYDLPPFIDRFFVPDLAYALWLIAPLVVLFF